MDARIDDAANDPFDTATAVAFRDGKLIGHTSADFRAFVGPFGGFTAAAMLRALIGHPQRLGDALSFTINFCAPIADGPFEIAPRLIKANRSTQHWSAELIQGDSEPAAFATAVFAQRRPTWSHLAATPPDTTSFARTPVYTRWGATPWVRQFEFRFVDNEPLFNEPHAAPASARSAAWIANRTPRRLDALSLLAMSDAFFARIFHVRGEALPIGTVSLTTYFHVDADDLAQENASAVLGVADASVFHKSYGDQTGELWSPGGRLLATTSQITYFKA